MILKAAPVAWTLAAGVAAVGGVTAVVLHASSSSTGTGFTGGGGNVSTGSASGSTGNAKSNNGNGNGNGGSGSPGHAIGVTWTLDGPLTLGRLGTLAVTVMNQNSQAIDVQTVSVSVNSSNKAGCDKTWLLVGSFSGPAQRAEAGKPTSINLPIQLQDKAANQDACKGASFNLTVTATGAQA